MLGIRRGTRALRPATVRRSWRWLAYSLAISAAMVVGWSALVRALAVGGQAYYAFVGNVSILGIPVPVSFGPLPLAEVPPGGGVDDESLASIDVGVPITGPTIFRAGAIQAHAEGDTTSNFVLSRATGGQVDIFPVPIVGTTGLLRAASFELECRLDGNGFTSHAAIGGVESTLLPDVFDDALWADPPPNTGLTIEGLGSVFMHEVTQEQVGNLTVYKANGVRIELNATAIPAGGATGEIVWGHVECAAERPIPTAVAPASGPAGTVVTITGTGFRPDAQVDFAGIPATSVTYVSPTELTATVPTMLGGTWNVNVITPVDRGTLANAFTAIAALPGLSSDNFTGQAFGVQASLTPAAILGPISFGPRPVATLPPGGGIDTDSLVDLPAIPGGDLVPGGLLTTGLLETRVQGSPANITLLAQNSIKDVNIGGGLLQVTDLLVKCELGPTGLTGSTDLIGIASPVIPDLIPQPPPNFGITIPGVGSAVLNEQIATTDPVTGRQTLAVNAIHVTANLIAIAGELIIGHAECSIQPPTVTGVTPNTGSDTGGTPVTIAGAGFGGQPTVTFGGVPATNVAVVDANTITATTPAHAVGPVDVTVSMPTGTPTLPGGFTYLAIADLTIIVTGPANTSPGSPLVYTIQVSNNGSAPATGVQVDLPTPAGLTFVSNSGACTTAFPCALGTIGPATSATITSTFDVPMDYAGPNPIAATATAASPDDPAPGNNSQTILTPVVPATAASISISMTVDNPSPNVGDQVTFTVTAHNSGPLPATGVTVVDKLPAGLTLVSATPAAGTTYDPATGLWTVPSIPNGADVTLQLVATTDAPGAITNTATKTGGDQPDPDASDNVAAVTLNASPTADVRVSKTASVTAGGVGDTVTFTIEATNVGPNDATGVVVNDLLPAGLTFTSATPSTGAYDPATGDWTIGTIPVGASHTLTIMATIADTAPVTNVARKTAQNEFDPVDDTDQGGVTINGESADLQLIMTLDPSHPAPGTPVTVTLTLTNNGPGAATGVEVQHALPGGLIFDSFTPPDQGSFDPATNTWTVGAMPPTGPDATATLQVVGVVPATGTTDAAPIASGDQPDPNPANNSPGPIDLPGGAADLQVTITGTGDLSVPGSPVEYQIGIRNVGTAPSNGPITVALLLPPNVQITSPPAGWDCSATGQTYTCTRDDLSIPPGGQTSLTIGGTVTGAGSNDTPAVVVVSNPGDPNPSNNIATFPATPSGAPGAADLIVTQTAVENPAGTLTVAFRVANQGPAAAEGVTLVDPLPPNVTLISATAQTGSCTGTTTIVCSLGTIDPGAHVDGTIVLQLPAAGVVTHTLSAGGLGPDPDLSNSLSILTHLVQGSLIVDGDGDGMPDALETMFGLDTTRNDADEDPDGDGRTNAQELAEGTHPRGFFSRFFAEGANGVFFDTNFTIFNTDPGQPARVLARLLLDSGGAAGRYVPVLPLRRADVSADDILGTIEAAFAAVIESDVPFAADRVMQWNHDGYGLSLESNPTPPSTTWYFAEGATHGSFDLFYLLANPSPSSPATVSATYLRPTGPPVLRTYTVAPNSRLTVHVDEVPGLAETDVAATFTSTNGVPIVVERAMYVSSAGRVFEAGHAVAGANAPSTAWFMAETATGDFFNAFVLLANPGSEPANVTILYQLPDGTSFAKSYVVAPLSRFTFNVALEDPRLAASSFSMALTSTQPIVAERAMWWPTPAMAPEWYGAHASMGATAAATRWAVAGGANGLADNWNTYVLVANQAGTTGLAKLTIVFDDATSVEQVLSLPPTSRTTLDVGGAHIPEARNRRFSILVESVGASPAPLVVDVSRYTSTASQFWSAGASAGAIAVPLVP